MNTEDRQNNIKELIEREGRVNVGQLADFYGKSQATIRNDLKEMESKHLLQRVHGGAISQKSAYRSYYETTLNERMNINKTEKLLIAKACADLVSDGEIIMIDSGTTNIYVARELSQRNNLTILTNAVFVAQEFYYNAGISVILFGGEMEFTSQFTHGYDTIAQLSKYRADKFILSIDGISSSHGVTTFHYQETEVSRQMMQRAKKVIAVCDHSKIGVEGFSYISELDSIHTLVTDRYEQNHKALDAIRSQGIEVIEVGVK